MRAQLLHLFRCTPFVLEKHGHILPTQWNVLPRVDHGPSIPSAQGKKEFHTINHVSLKRGMKPFTHPRNTQ